MGHVREARELWQLTPVGRDEHRRALQADVGGAALDDLNEAYAGFLELNEAFKALCADWQLRDGQPNDHSDAAYDAAVVARLLAIDGDAQPIVRKMGDVLERLAPYAPRLEHTCQQVAAGETKMFTGVHVRQLSRCLDGAARRSDPHPRHRPHRRGIVLMARFGRVLSAMVTPFDDDGALDLDEARRLAQWLESNGHDGLVVAGTTGEPRR
jgi:hypothetical protein